MKTPIIVGAAILAALAFAVVATLLGGRVSNQAVAMCDPNCYTNTVKYESYGWPIPWRIDDGAAESAEIGTSGVSVTSFALSVALWSCVALAPLMVALGEVNRRWLERATVSIAIACVVTLGLATVATVLGALKTDSGLHISGDIRLRYESSGWPVEWKTNPWLWAGLDSPPKVYDQPSRDTYHTAMRPYNALGYSPAWLAFNFVLCTIIAVVAEFLVATLVRVVFWSRRRLSRSRAGAASA